MLHLFHQPRNEKKDTRYTVLLDDLARTKKELDHVYAAFSNVTDQLRIGISVGNAFYLLLLCQKAPAFLRPVKRCFI